jgi:hypothetical protein
MEASPSYDQQQQGGDFWTFGSQGRVMGRRAPGRLKGLSPVPRVEVRLEGTVPKRTSTQKPGTWADHYAEASDSLPRGSKVYADPGDGSA